MTGLLSARDLGYRPVDRTVLDGVWVDAHPGELLAVTGPSGSGKTSLLALLAGLAAPTTGQVLLDGAPLSPGTSTGFGIVLQGYGLVHVLTAAENVEVVLQARRGRRGRTRTRAAAALAEVGLAALADRPVEELSGGQRQRVAVARALVVHPRVLIADEPTAQQDADTKAAMLALLRRAADGGAAVVLATHDPEVVERCDRELALYDGRVVSTGPAGRTGGGPGAHR